MTQQTEAEEYGRCVRCGRYSGPEVLCVLCDAAADAQGEGRMDEDKLSQNQAAARRLGLPRVVWEAASYRVVEYYEQDDDRIHLDLEHCDGVDRMGESRWAVVRKPNSYEQESTQAAYHWADAFWALATPLFVPPEEAERRRTEDARRRRRVDEMGRYEPW